MTDAKKAKEIAEENLKVFFPDAANIHLVEIELDSNKKNWSVTLSYDVTPTTPSEILSIKKTTLYKVFKVESKSGSLLSMKNRDMNKKPL